MSLPDICRDLIEERQPVLGSSRITVDVADDALVVADPTRITQVIDNLVTNALRYGGPHVEVRAVREGAHVVLTVTDDGDGIPDDLLDTLFNAYVHGTSSLSLGGSGLGLLIVRQLCEAMSGTIEYDAKEGARFTATFPALPVPTQVLDPDVASGHSVSFWHTDDEPRGESDRLRRQRTGRR